MRTLLALALLTVTQAEAQTVVTTVTIKPEEQVALEWLPAEFTPNQVYPIRINTLSPEEVELREQYKRLTYLLRPLNIKEVQDVKAGSTGSQPQVNKRR